MVHRHAAYADQSTLSMVLEITMTFFSYFTREITITFRAIIRLLQVGVLSRNIPTDYTALTSSLYAVGNYHTGMLTSPDILLSGITLNDDFSWTSPIQYS